MERWTDICFMIDSLERGGAQRQLLLLAKTIFDRGIPSFTLIVFRSPLSLEADFKSFGVNVVFIPKHKEIDLGFLKNLARFLIKEKPKAVVTFLPTADMWGRLVAKLTGVPVVGCSVRTLPQKYGTVKDFFLRFMDNFSSFIVCNSQAAASKITKENIKLKGKVHLIYNGIERRDLPVNSNKGKHTFTIGLVARLVSVKNINILLRSVTVISNEFKCRLVIVGDGPLRGELEDEAKYLGLSSLVSFVGESDNPHEYISGFDVGVLVSEYEGLSNVIMEYMLNALPVIATNVGGNPELVVDGKTGCLIAVGEVDQLVVKLRELIISNKLRESMGREGYNRISRNFSVKQMAEKWTELLEGHLF